MRPVVMVCESCPDADPSALTVLADQGFEVERYASTAELVESVTRRQPAAAIVRLMGLGPEESELQMLRLLRRIAPVLPLVVITDGSSFAVQRSLRALHPMYLALAPVDRDELAGAVRGALARVRPTPS